MDAQETIFALATPRGRGGIAVIRISGARAAEAFFALGVSLPPPRTATRHFYRNASENLDDGISLWFPCPHSYTGEHVVELQVHASPSVIAEIMGILGKLTGFRLAEPGEFTRRAFLNGKMDLTAAEGVADLIDAETPIQRRQALRLMSGEAAAQCLSWREKILRALALFEAVLDFPDEDLPPYVLAEGEKEIEELAKELTSYLTAPPVAERIRDGFVIAVLGAPNVGKSTLINELSGRDMAIVSPVPGTTRDILESPLNLSGYPVILTDTAGLRESTDSIEQEGIRRARARAEAADFKLLVLDAGNASASFHAVQDHISDDALIIINKCDSYDPQDTVGLLARYPVHTTILCVSLHKPEAIGRLRKALSDMLCHRYNQTLPMITRQRHRNLIQDAVHAMERALSPLPLELRCEELRLASVSLGKMTGHIDTEEILGEIFKSFCIGK